MNTQHFEYYFQEAPAEWFDIDENGKAGSAVFYFNDSIKRWDNNEETEEDAKFEWDPCYLFFNYEGVKFYLVCDRTQALCSIWGRIVEILNINDDNMNMFDYEFYDINDDSVQFNLYSNFCEYMGEKPELFIKIVDTA